MWAQYEAYLEQLCEPKYREQVFAYNEQEGMLRSRSMILLPSKFLPPPRYGQPTVTPDRFRRNVEGGGDRLFSQAAEETHFHDLRFAPVKMGERAERFIERHQIFTPPLINIIASSSDICCAPPPRF